MKKTVIYLLTTVLCFILLPGCDDENDRRDEQWEKESAEWSKNYGTHKADDYVPPADLGTEVVAYYEDVEEGEDGKEEV